MGCKALYHSVALFLCLMKGLHVRAQCSKPRFEGDVVLSEQHILTDSFTEGDQVTFECIPGYKPADPRASRSVTCQGKQWTNLGLTCTRKSCGSPSEFLNGRYEITSGILFGDTIRAVCNKGFELYGSAERTCRAEGVWDGRDPECEALKCASPPVIENGQIEEGYDMNMEYSYGEVVTYKCKAGFSLDGSADVVCSENGSFHPEPPKCVDGCVKPNIPHAVRTVGRSPPYKLGSILEYKCENGYDMKGEGYIVCKGHGWEPNPPQCIGYCEPPTFEQHGVSKPSDSKTKFSEGSRLTFKCLSGYKAVDSSASNVVTCLDRQWTPLELTCKDSSCGLPVFERRGVMSGQSKTKFPEGSSVTFECLSGYKPLDSKASNVITCVDGKWTPLELTCEGFCGSPPFGGHAAISGQSESKTNFPEGSSVTFECLSGYKPLDSKASNVITCVDGKWTPLELTCEGENSYIVPAVASVLGLLGLVAIVATVVVIQKKKSKHEYSEKVETNEEREL